MRWLTFSLMLATVAAAMGMGWLLDQSYQRINPEHGRSEHEKLVELSRAYVDSHAKSLIDIPLNDQITIFETSLSDTLLPKPLMDQLDRGDTVVLESEDTLYLHQLNTATNTVFNFEVALPETKQYTGERLILTLLFYIGIVILIMLWLWPLLVSLERIRKHLHLFGEGRLAERIQSHRFSYLKDVENGFNHMALRIEQLVEDNRLLSRAVSHDLRTPIARLRFGVDLLGETRNQSEHKKHLAHLNNDLDEMESLVETLLAFAKLEQTHMQVKLKNENLVELTREIARNYQHSQRVIDVRYEKNDLHALLDKKLMSMLLNNVIGNAIQHAKHHVCIHITEDNESIRLIVEDDGTGIAEDQLEKVLMPFYRADSQKPGHGMGLAIVARIAKWHDAKILLGRSTTLDGLSLTLTFNKGYNS